MYVVLDTNIIHQETLFSRNMKILERLAISGKVKVCVPELVLKEYVSKKSLEAKELLKKPKSLFAEIQTLLPNSKVVPCASKLEELSIEFEKSLELSYIEAVEKWLKDLKVEVLKFDPSMLSKVFDDYFEGEGAFRSPKFRDDIPDSFIGYSLLPLVDKGEDVNVLVKDGGFNRYLKKQKLNVFTEMGEFLSSEKVQEFVNQLDAETAHVNELKKFLNSEHAITQLRENISNDKSMLAEIYLEEENISGQQSLGMFVFGTSINGTTPEYIQVLDFGGLSYVEPGYFSIVLRIIADCDVSFAGDYGEYMSLPPSRKRHLDMSSMNGDGWCDLTELRPVELQGYLQVHFDETWTVKDLAKQLADLSDKHDEFSIEFEINSARLLAHST